MIEINLLPQELKIRPKSKKLTREPKTFLYFIPLIFSLLVLAHFCLAFFGIFESYQLRALANKWKHLAPQRKILEDFKRENSMLFQDTETIQRLISQRINWAEKLNKLSLNLSSGVWFSEISLKEKKIILNGSVISLEEGEISLINKFLDRLKKDRGFFSDFKNLELTSAEARKISGYDIVNFVLSGELKN